MPTARGAVVHLRSSCVRFRTGERAASKGSEAFERVCAACVTLLRRCVRGRDRWTTHPRAISVGCTTLARFSVRTGVVQQMCGHGGRRYRGTVPSAGFGKAGQARWDGGRLGVGCGGEAEKPEVFSVGGPNDEPLASACPASSASRIWSLFSATTQGWKSTTGPRSSRRSSTARANSWHTPWTGTWPAGQEGSQGGESWPAVQCAADPTAWTA